MSLPGYDDWKTTPPIEEDLTALTEFVEAMTPEQFGKEMARNAPKFLEETKERYVEFLHDKIKNRLESL